jgi:hypothetical protein
MVALGPAAKPLRTSHSPSLSRKKTLQCIISNKENSIDSPAKPPAKPLACQKTNLLIHQSYDIASSKNSPTKKKTFGFNLESAAPQKQLLFGISTRKKKSSRREATSSRTPALNQSYSGPLSEKDINLYRSYAG